MKEKRPEGNLWPLNVMDMSERISGIILAGSVYLRKQFPDLLPGGKTMAEPTLSDW